MITNSKLVFDLEGSQTVNSVLTAITDKLVDEGFAKSKKPVLDGFKAREAQTTTGLADGIAIPHVSSEAITEAKIVVVKLKEAVDWKALDGKPTDFVIAIAVPADGRNDHFDLLTQISGKLADPGFVASFKKSSNEEIVKTLTTMKVEEKKTTTKASGNSIKVVGVTTCITGVAHTFMAAQALEDEGAKRGWDVKIERQGQMTKGSLKPEDIEAADYVVLGVSKSIDGQERFNGKKVWTVEVAEPITKAAKVLDDMVANATVQQGGPGGSSVKSTGGASGSHAGFMSHMMAGISYMIPYIAMAGIVLGLTTAFGYAYFDPLNPNYAGATGFQPKGPFANALNTLAGGGFTLYIPILSMFIANSIAGRKAMAPAAILALVLNTAPDTSWFAEGGPAASLSDGFAPFFNYGTGGFYGWEHSPALGFLGAIVAGYMVGYGVQAFANQTDKVNSAPFQAIVPLLIIPILFTVVPWLFMAFVGYIPLYGLSLGLNAAVNGLIDINMLWLAGGLMGVMICFDLGGPVNKMAMVIGSMMLAQGIADPSFEGAVLNGVCAVAVSLPPTVLFFSTITHRFTPIRMDEQDITAGYTASLMGVFGITEGSIPFAAKDPKKWMPAFMVAGFIGGALAPMMGVVDNVPMWGGPIIWAAGGYGSTLVGSTWQASNWGATMLYFIPLLAGGLAGFGTAAGLDFIYARKEAKLAFVKNA